MRPEEGDLSAGVVDVVLALDIAAGGGEHGGEGVAEHCAASVADLERPGGVGGDEFDLDALRSAGGGAAPLVAGGDHVEQAAALPVGVDAEVDEAGAGGFDVGDQLVALDAGGDGFCDVERGHAHGAGEAHGEVAGVVAVLGVLGALDADFGCGHGGQGAVVLGAPEGVGEGVAQQFARVAGHGVGIPRCVGAVRCSGYQRSCPGCSPAWTTGSATRSTAPLRGSSR